MSRFQVLIFAVVFLLASLAAAKSPPLTYDWLNVVSPNEICNFMGQVQIASPSAAYAAYSCAPRSNPSASGYPKVAFINFLRNSVSVHYSTTQRSPADVGFGGLQTYGTDSAIFTTRGGDSMIASLSPLKINWQQSRYNATGGFAIHHDRVYVAMGPHMIDRHMHASVTAFNLNTGAIEDEIPLDPTMVVGNVIVKENRVIFMANDTLYSAASLHSRASKIKSKHPCGMHAAPNTVLSFDIVQYGTDFNGPLHALMIWGQTATSSPKGNFTVCRVHHGAYNFGQPEWVYLRPSKVIVNGVTGGGGAILFAWMNISRLGDSYGTGIFNASLTSSSANPLQEELMQDATNLGNVPVVLEGELGPRVLWMETAGSLWLDNIYPSSPAFAGMYLSNTPLCTAVRVGVSSRAFCAGPQSVYSIAYNGTVSWTLDETAVSFPPVIYDQTTVFIQAPSGIAGYEFDAEWVPPPSNSQQLYNSGGMSAGSVVLILFVIAFALLMFGLVGRHLKNKGIVMRKTGASRAQIDRDEGYAGLNA